MSANPIVNRTANPTENPNVVERYFRAVVARPWTVIALSAVFVFASGAFLPSMVMDTRSDAFIDVDEPALVYREKVEELFGLADPIVIAVTNDSPAGIYNPDSLRLVQELTEAVQALTNVDPERVVSLATPPGFHARRTTSDPTARTRLPRWSDTAPRHPLPAPRCRKRGECLATPLAGRHPRDHRRRGFPRIRAKAGTRDIRAPRGGRSGGPRLLHRDHTFPRSRRGGLARGHPGSPPRDTPSGAGHHLVYQHTPRQRHRENRSRSLSGAGAGDAEAPVGSAIPPVSRRAGGLDPHRGGPGEGACGPLGGSMAGDD